jgi:hypothetical protein
VSECKEVFHQSVGITCNHFVELVKLKQQLAERDALILELEKIREFYSCDANYQSVHVGYGDKSQLKHYDMIDISEDDLVRNIGGKLARTPLKNQGLLDDIKEGVK